MFGFLAAGVVLASYLAFPSSRWNFDGVACASALELGNPVYWFHSQHLLYGFFGWLFWKATSPIGFERALPALQLFTSLMSAVGIGIVWRIVRNRLAEPGRDAIAIVLAAACGWTAAHWVWSVEVQVYPLGFLGLAAATWALLDAPAGERKGLWAGAAWALAVLGHAVHLLWIIPACAFLKNDRVALRFFLIAGLGGIAAAYILVTVSVLLPYQGGMDALSLWWKGSLGLTADRSLAWHGAIHWTGFWDWLRATPGAIWGTFEPYARSALSAPVRIATVLSIFCGGYLLYRLKEYRRQGDPATRRLILFCGLWIIPYAVFFSTWEPSTLCYRMSDGIPWILLLTLGVRTLPTLRWRAAAAGTWAASLLLINAWTLALPMRQTSRNAVYTQTVEIAKVSPDTSIYLTGGGLPWIYLLYFTGRSAWNAHTLDRERFQKEWEATSPRPPLFVHTSLLSEPWVLRWTSGRRARQVTPELPWMEIPHR